MSGNPAEAEGLVVSDHTQIDALCKTIPYVALSTLEQLVWRAYETNATNDRSKLSEATTRMVANIREGVETKLGDFDKSLSDSTAAIITFVCISLLNMIKRTGKPQTIELGQPGRGGFYYNNLRSPNGVCTQAGAD